MLVLIAPLIAWLLLSARDSRLDVFDHRLQTLRSDWCGGPMHELEDIEEGYRGELSEANSKRAWASLGRVLELEGKYDGAVEAYGKGGAKEAALALDDRLTVAHQSEIWLHDKQQVLQVARLEADRWLVLAGYYFPGGEGKTEEDFKFPHFSQVELILLTGSAGQPLALSSRLAPIVDADWPDAEEVNMVPVWFGKQPGVLLYHSLLGGDNYPNFSTFYRLDGDRLSKVGTFFGKAETRLASNGSESPLALMVTATWKVWWPDTYRWSGRAFEFANQDFAKKYGPKYWIEDKSTGGYYPVNLGQAAVAAINRDWVAARRFLRLAERNCLRCIAGYRRDKTSASFDRPYPDYGWFGDADANLREIRQRLRWIAHHDYAHPLLYRPYDFDLQVSPFRLGDPERK